MHTSRFCPCPEGDSPSAKRQFLPNDASAALFLFSFSHVERERRAGTKKKDTAARVASLSFVKDGCPVLFFVRQIRRAPRRLRARRYLRRRGVGLLQRRGLGRVRFPNTPRSSSNWASLSRARRNSRFKSRVPRVSLKAQARARDVLGARRRGSAGGCERPPPRRRGQRLERRLERRPARIARKAELASARSSLSSFSLVLPRVSAHAQSTREMTLSV